MSLLKPVLATVALGIDGPLAVVILQQGEGTCDRSLKHEPYRECSESRWKIDFMIENV